MTGANQEALSAKPLSNEEAAQRLEQLERWSKHNSQKPANSNTSRYHVQKALIDLQKNPKIAVPLLSKSFIDKTKDRAFRLNCAQLLRESGENMPVEDSAKLETVVVDPREDPLIRVFAAHFILRESERHPTALKGTIANMAVDFLRKGKETDFVRMLIIPGLAGSPQIERILLEELRAEHDLDATLYALGRIRSQNAVSPIVRLLKSKRAGKDFYKTRGYLALGEIGGAAAYGHLVEFLATEPSEIERNMILLAIGRSRDPRAKSLLTDFLLQKPNGYYITALRALRLLGDPSVIPTLERECEKPLPAYQKGWVIKTISAIKEHDKEPDY
ncbi:MAG: hypothetical protein NTX64_00230 [Elusimicrobia bacterium]|nr:hypothetical protein [Elusimicrobiota bacterium]